MPIPENAAQRYRHRTPLDHDVLRDLKVLVDAGQVDALAVRDEHGRTLLQVPVAPDAGAEALAPVWAALGAVAAGGFECTVEARVAAGGEGGDWPPEPTPNSDEER